MRYKIAMGYKLSAYKTKELSEKSWPDFERLFSRGNGWDHCQCMHFHRPCALPKTEWLRSRAERAVRNRGEKKKLVERGRSHGVLVYANGEPVGWCQYGRAEELPRIDSNRNYGGLAPPPSSLPQWRITCFVVDRKHRRRGVATVALRAALDSIAKRGGGIIEAFPLVEWEDFRRSELRQRGHAPSFGNMSTHGTVSMFQKHGFETIGAYGAANVVMRKKI